MYASCLEPLTNSERFFHKKKGRVYSDGMENCMLAVTISIYPSSGGLRKIK